MTFMRRLSMYPTCACVERSRSLIILHVYPDPIEYVKNTLTSPTLTDTLLWMRNHFWLRLICFEVTGIYTVRPWRRGLFDSCCECERNQLEFLERRNSGKPPTLFDTSGKHPMTMISFFFMIFFLKTSEETSMKILRLFQWTVRTHLHKAEFEK